MVRVVDLEQDYLVARGALEAVGGVSDLKVQSRGQDGRPEISIILATLNEAANLPKLLREIEVFCKAPYEIVIVDDGSTDGTLEQINSWSYFHNNVQPILNSASRGLLNAQLQGLTHASGHFAIVMDSDLQHPPSLIPSIYKNLRAGEDLVIASRYVPGGSAGDRKPVRGVISRGATWLSHFLLPQTRGVSDPLSGYFGMNLDSARLYGRGHDGYKILLFILASSENPRIAEVPYVFHERRNGGSKVVNRTAFIPTFLRELLADRRLSSTIRAIGSGHSVSGQSIVSAQAGVGQFRR